MANHNYYMELALAQAQKALEIDEVPVGAVVVLEDQVIGQGYNRRENDNDPCAHAELIAIQKAAQYIGNWRLCDSTLYVTLEPCPMCAGAIINSRIKCVIYGANDPKAGAVTSLYSLLNDPRLNHRAEVISGVMADDCSAMLRNFFLKLRHKSN